MTKSLSFDFVGLARALLVDFARCYPNDQIEWDRDSSRLALLVENRGISVFTMDLPLVRKHLDRCLADGYLSKASVAYMRVKSPRTKLPRLFWGLWSKIFDDSGCLKPNIDPNAVLFLRTMCDLGKNLEADCAPRYLFEATEEFYDVEANLAPPSQVWDGGIPEGQDSPSQDDESGHRYGGTYHGPSFGLPGRFAAEFLRDEDPRVVSVLQYVQRHADRIAGLIGNYRPDEWSFRHGPGAVSDLRRNEYKYSFLRWSRRLEELFPFDRYGCTPIGYTERLNIDGIDVTLEEGCSKLIAVPKTMKGPRLIASEPSYNQWAQQNIRDFLYNRVEQTSLGASIHFRDQRFNQKAALKGSLDGSLATIDLKSASDRLSCWLVETLFRRNEPLLKAFSAVRTRYITQKLDKSQSRLHKIRKFTTMGSALTFPVQSLVFLAIAAGVGNYIEPHLGLKEVQEKVLVFGDDIVVPNHWTEALARVLELLGLKVNRSKTFSTGNFRESCGMDAFFGADVTPPHITLRACKSNPRSIVSSVAVSNNFFTKGFWHAADWLREAIGINNIPVVALDSGTFGFKSFVGGVAPRKIRWNTDLQREEGLCFSIIAKARTSKQNAAAALLQYFTEEPPPYINYDSGVVVAGKPVSRRRWVPLSDFVYSTRS